MRTFPGFLLAIALALLSGRASAEPPQMPQGSGPVPRLSASVKVGAVVSAESANLYRSLLPAEVSDLVARDRLTFEAATVDLPQISVAAAPSVKLLASGELESPPPQASSPLFSVALKDMEPLSHAERGYRLLWNTEAVQWSQRAFSETLRVLLFPSIKSEGRQLEIELARVYPAALGQGGKGSKALFRERLRFRSPAALASLSWLSFRLSGISDDYVWAASPVTHSVSQLSGSVRTEEIFPSGFSANDMHVWSGKVESVVPQKAERLVMLVPVLGDAVKLGAQHGGQCFGFDRPQPPVVMNVESRRFPSQPGWVPTNVRFVPRWVWRLDLSSRDPYDLDAIHSLYVDEETSLPVYRASWRADGTLRKVVLGVVGFLGYENRTIPWLLGELVHNAPADSFVAMRTKAAGFCAGSVPGLTLEDFDPATLSAQLESLKKAAAARPAEEEGSPPEED